MRAGERGLYHSQPSPAIAQRAPSTSRHSGRISSSKWVNPWRTGASARAGPGRTYLVMGALHAGDVVDPVARTADFTWVMIRLDEVDAAAAQAEFAWVLADLIRWQDDLGALPVVDFSTPDNLTPTVTDTPTSTPTPTSITLASESGNNHFQPTAMS